MSIQEAETKVKDAGLSIEAFWKWMIGQTLSLNDDGTTEVPDCDVRRFVNGRGNCVNWD